MDMTALATRIAYASRQLPRVAWYTGHFYALRFLAQQQKDKFGGNGERSKARPDRTLDQHLKNDILALFETDFANVRAGIYPIPADHDGSLVYAAESLRIVST